MFSHEDLSTIYGALCDSVQLQRGDLDEANRLKVNNVIIMSMRGAFCKTQNLRRIMADRLSAMERGPG